jgi:transposase
LRAACLVLQLEDKAVRTAPKINVTEEDRKVLDRWARGRSTPARLVLRAKIVLESAAGQANQVVAEKLGTDRLLVGKWRMRFAQKGLGGIEKDAPRGGRPAVAREGMTARIIEWTTRHKPRNATHWSCRTLAEELGTSKAMVNRVWMANGLKPHLSRTFKLSNDKRFIEKVIDVVGLYLNPPEHALVLCVDEKTQIQALDRTQPGLPLKKGRCGTMTHDYKRNGTTTLFAALNVAEGKLIGTCMPRHRHQEWIKFLKQIDEQTPFRIGPAPDRGQLQHAQAPEGAELAQAASEVSHALHPDQQFLAQPGGTLVPPNHRQTNPSRRLSQRAPTHRSDHGLHR